jgi:hypothetical protein
MVCGEYKASFSKRAVSNMCMDIIGAFEVFQ